MSKDIREIIKDYSQDQSLLSKNHRDKFQARLKKEMHSNQLRRSYSWFQIAASIIVLLSVGVGYYTSQKETIIPAKNISLGTISPELKTLETYYANSINYEISTLSLNKGNKEILDGYLAKIGELTKEYKSLTTELNTKGVNNNTINALIDNLQLRLQLLQRLKKQLKELKNLKTDQNETQQL